MIGAKRIPGEEVRPTVVLLAVRNPAQPEPRWVMRVGVKLLEVNAKRVCAVGARRRIPHSEEHELVGGRIDLPESLDVELHVAVRRRWNLVTDVVGRVRHLPAAGDELPACHLPDAAADQRVE